MDVTRENFYSILPNLKKAVSEAEFVAIDLEFSGLTSGGRDLEAMPFDTPQQYYEKVYQKALDFLPLQLGVCIFQYDATKNRYTYQAYNFYIFPFSKLKGFPDCTFQCQSSSLAFLSSCGFDFNKAFGKGIPFLAQPEEDKLQTAIEERQQKIGKDNNAKESHDVPIPEDLKNQFQNHMKKIREFMEDSSGNRGESFTLDNCNRFMRRILYQEVPKEFGDTVQLETSDDSNFAMKVMKGGGDELKKLREEEKKKKEKREFEEAVGLAHLIKAISESGKLVVGHNCLLDVCHLVNRFRYPLPSSYDNFKELVHHIFPRIIDTKFMSTAPQFKDIIPSCSLGQLMETVSGTPFEMPAVEGNVEGHSYSKLIDKSHEGGFDAFITGQCFLAMCQYLAKDEKRDFKNIESLKDILSNIENRLYLMRVQDVPYMRLGAPDTKPPRGHVFHLTFPREWRQFDVVELFKPFGPVFISFIDNQSAFVALHKTRRNQAKSVLQTMAGNETFKLTSFAAFQKQRERQSPLVPPPASPSVELLRKRKLREKAEVLEPTNIFKKHCRPEQPKRSIGPIPEEVESDNTGAGEASVLAEVNEDETSKEFPENEVWG